MTINEIIFLVPAFLLISSSVAMITARNTIHSALFLILSFFSAACLWLLLESEFLAITLILVYIGAILVLFLFVIMMLNITKSEQQAKFTGYLPLGILVALAIIIEMSLVLGPQQFGLDIMPAPAQHLASHSNITQLALELYTVYVYPFELASVLLLIAIISAIVLVQRTGSRRLTQDVHQQISVKPQDRLHIIKDKNTDL